MKPGVIDIVEYVARKLDLNFSRIEDEITIHLEDARYIMTAIWKPDYDVLYFSCDIGLIVSEDKYLAVADVLAKINERVWIGHFDFLSGHNRIIYSLPIPFISSLLIEEELIESIFQIVTNECSRCYHCFEIVLHDAAEPNCSALFMDAVGEA